VAQLWRSSSNCARFKPEIGAVHGHLRHAEVEDEVSGMKVCPIAHPFTPNMARFSKLRHGPE
jgi:hypothetical protein